MRISLNNLWLTNDGNTDLHLVTDAHDVHFNGTQLVQDAQFLRAVAAQPFARGNLSHQLRFTVTRQHVSAVAAASFLLTALSTALSTAPTSGLAQMVCGALGETPITCTMSAVLENIDGQFHGTRSDLTYTLRGGLITLTSGVSTLLDGGTFTAQPFDLGLLGTLDGGTFRDSLQPLALALDGGNLTSP